MNQGVNFSMNQPPIHMTTTKLFLAVAVTATTALLIAYDQSHGTPHLGINQAIIAMAVLLGICLGSLAIITTRYFRRDGSTLD